MKHFFLLLAISFAFFSCSNDDQVDNSSDTLAKKATITSQRLRFTSIPRAISKGNMSSLMTIRSAF